MGEVTSIAWCDATFNPWWGCAKVSAGCQHCYAEAQAQRFEKDRGLWGPGARRRVTGDAYWRQPERWNRAAAAAGERRRVFCASMADVFEDRADLDRLRVRLFDVIRRTPHLDWLLLTKRPEAALGIIKRVGILSAGIDVARMAASWCGGEPPSNVWLGTTAETQATADERVPALLSIPARVRFLSCEPLLEGIDLRPAAFNGADSFGSLEGLHWIIVGGESGHHARPCDVEWIASIIKQCTDAAVPVFAKQLGSAACVAGDEWSLDLRDPKGGDPDEWPEHLRVRQIPVRP